MSHSSDFWTDSLAACVVFDSVDCEWAIPETQEVDGDVGSGGGDEGPGGFVGDVADEGNGGGYVGGVVDYRSSGVVPVVDDIADDGSSGVVGDVGDVADDGFSGVAGDVGDVANGGVLGDVVAVDVGDVVTVDVGDVVAADVGDVVAADMGAMDDDVCLPSSDGVHACLTKEILSWWDVSASCCSTSSSVETDPTWGVVEVPDSGCSDDTDSECSFCEELCPPKPKWKGRRYVPPSDKQQKEDSSPLQLKKPGKLCCRYAICSCSLGL